MRFIDLFSGLGGFHLALSGLGHQCVFASELDADLALLYEQNFGIRPVGDIRRSLSQVPPHDILCAGFPCQPFSKAGGQMGFGCPESGDLFDYVVRILRTHKPKFLILENVPNILRHNDGESWRVVAARLRSAGYSVDAKVLSPHQFGVPQNRDRAFIVGSRDGLTNFRWPSRANEVASIYSVLDSYPPEARALPPMHLQYLETWQKFLTRFPKKEELPSFPIWAMECGATYPIEPLSPYGTTLKDLRRFRGAFGVDLSTAGSKREALAMLPRYAQTAQKKFPQWKRRFILQNREFLARYSEIISDLLPVIQTFPPSFQKLEWNWKGGPKNLWQSVIQFRASGIRAKRVTTAPSLVAFTPSQVPVIAWERRYMTVRECARLQSMDALEKLPFEESAGFSALGNAVNVRVVGLIANSLVGVAVHGSKERVVT